MSQLSRKCEIPDSSQPYRPSQPVTGVVFSHSICGCQTSLILVVMIFLYCELIIQNPIHIFGLHKQVNTFTAITLLVSD
jgi:hypothetical protein